MKYLVLETKEERTARHLGDDKKRKKLRLKKKEPDNVRHAQLLPKENVLLCKELRSDLDLLCKKHNLKDSQKERVITDVRGVKYTFQLTLARQLQNYLPLHLEYLKREIRFIREYSAEVFGSSLEEYKEKYVSGFKLDDKEPNLSIEMVWKGIISDEAKFPLMSKLLRSCLSIFHSTATVEGSINTTRNILNERGHSMMDETLNARKTMKSAVKKASSKCCFDYKIEDQQYFSNWNNAPGEYVKTQKKGINVEQSSDEDDSDIRDKVSQNEKKDDGHSKESKAPNVVSNDSVKDSEKDDHIDGNNNPNRTVEALSDVDDPLSGESVAEDKQKLKGRPKKKGRLSLGQKMTMKDFLFKM